ncbi:MAG TPA: hypothetical protein PK509_08080 [Catalimonadaceae bacterium]|nr:hypothetical protein [Catalimonadaceae bacterium]HPI10247.1 hypothetical protein [Catalimonadaceae bacterium]
MKPNQAFLTLFSVVSLFTVGTSFAQTDSSNTQGSETVFQGFSAEMFPAKKTTRGSSLSLDDLSALTTGSIKLFDFQTQYKKVFLGADFYDVATKEKSCDSLRRKLGSQKSHFIPVSDGKFFSQTHFSKIQDLEGYYRFRNSKNLPGILPNVDVWVKMESYVHGKSTEKNCLVVKFLIPEDENGKIVEKAYVMRNDGILVAVPNGTDPDFSQKLDFSRYCIFPLNDPHETTHLVGLDFNILGSFARQKQCDNLKGLLFPTSRKGAASGCVFFRRMDPESAPRF